MRAIRKGGIKDSLKFGLRSLETTKGGGRFGGGGTEQKGERTHGHGRQCGDCSGEGSIRRLNGNAKKKKQ